MANKTAKTPTLIAIQNGRMVDIDSFIGELKNVRNLKGNVPVYVSIAIGDDAARAEKEASREKA